MYALLQNMDLFLISMANMSIAVGLMTGTLAGAAIPAQLCHLPGQH